MNRANLIRLSLRLANSPHSTRLPGPNWLSLNQVTRFSHLTESPSVSLSRTTLFHNSLNTHQYFLFSSKPEYLVELVLSNDWSVDIENELEKSIPKLTHEYVVYVMMKLNKNPQRSLEFFKWVSNKKQFDPSSLLYSILLRTLASKESMKQFWVTVSEMKGKGFYCDKHTYLTVHGIMKREKLDNDKVAWTEFYNGMSETYSDIVKNVVEVILGCDWSEEVEGKLKELKFPLSECFLLAVFKELWKQPLRALKFFEWVSDCRGYKHDSVTYNAMAKVLAYHESMREFWDIVNRMRREGCEIDTDSYIKISRHLRNGDAVDLFEFMMDGPYKPSVQDCTLLLKSIAVDQDPDMDLVYRVVNKYEASGNALTKAIYDGIHRSLCKVGRFDEAQKIVEAMRDAGYQPDNITYSQEVFGLCKLRRFEDAHKVFTRMKAEGCVPDLKTWTILTQGYCAADQVDQALTCLSKMMEQNADLDADLLEVLLNGFLSHNKFLGAYMFLTEMVKKIHLKPWHATYKLMIEKLLEAGKLEQAMNLLSMMKRHNYPPFPEPFVRYISKFGTMEDAKEFLAALTVKGPPSSSAYVHVIRSFVEEGRHSEAKDLLFRSPHRVRTHKGISNLFGSAKSSSAASC